MRIGIVDVDTSHPEHWISIEREMGHEVTGVWDGGSVHPAEYVRKFAEEHKLPRIYDSLQQMAKDVDCAIIHACDWDTHVEKARPFVEAGKSVFVDKPLAGNLSDLRQLLKWSENGARITGGSSLRFCTEAREFLKRPESERGVPHTVTCGCAIDDFNYGIHAYSMLSAVFGPGAASVRHLGKGVQRHVQVNWADGRMGFVTIGAAAKWLPLYSTIVTELTVIQFIPAGHAGYRAILTSLLPYLAGETAEPPVPFDALMEPELCALAARESWMNGDKEVRIAGLREKDSGYDGKAFVEGYRRKKYSS
jgi:hypothetical protein